MNDLSSLPRDISWVSPPRRTKFREHGRLYELRSETSFDSSPVVWAVYVDGWDIGDLCLQNVMIRPELSSPCFLAISHYVSDPTSTCDLSGALWTFEGFRIIVAMLISDSRAPPVTFGSGC